MKRGKRVILKDKLFFSHNGQLLGDPITVAKRLDCDFLYIVDNNFLPVNKDVYWALTRVKPFVVETRSRAVARFLNELECHVLAPFPTTHPIGVLGERDGEKYVVVYDCNNIQPQSKKLLCFCSHPLCYAVIEDV